MAFARSGNAKCQRMPHAPPKVLLHLTLEIDSLSLSLSAPGQDRPQLLLSGGPTQL